MHHSQKGLVFGSTGQNLLRILIASYFIAGGVGLIPGADITPLTDRLLPASASGPVAATITFILAYSVMVGLWLRGSALLLAILTFWASYVRIIELGLEAELGSFWRDLALIGSLMLTYAEPNPQTVRSRSLIHDGKPRRIRPRREVEEAPLPHPGINGYEGYRPAYGHDKLSVEEMEKVFQEDFKVARSG